MWLTIGTNLLDFGHSPGNDGLGVYVDEDTGTRQVKFPLLYGSADENIVAQMMAPLVYGSPTLSGS